LDERIWVECGGYVDWERKKDVTTKMGIHLGKGQSDEFLFFIWNFQTRNRFSERPGTNVKIY
jgi:hypothetical protein